MVEKKSEKKIEPKKEAKKEVKEPKEQKKVDKTAEAFEVLIYPLLSEKSISFVESQNKLVFIVRREARKQQIKWAVEKALEVKVDSVNTIIDRDGRKKAIIKLNDKFKAIDIATRFGML